MRFWSAYVCVCFLSFLAIAAWAADSGAGKPTVDKVDPPNWWASLPDPMLVVHGSHLEGARFSIDVPAVQLLSSESSPNGHWSILILKNTDSAPHQLRITAKTAAGATEFSFEISPRRQDANAHSGFSSHDVLYLLMPDRFAQGDNAPAVSEAERQLPRGWHGGDLAGIEKHIDYLKQLGVTAVWTTPVVSNGAMPDSYHGYAATDLYAIDPHFGTLADYRRLSDALHAQGVKLIIDLVPNHIGVQHPWVQDPPAPEWLHGSIETHRTAQFDLYQLVDPHAPDAAWESITSGWFAEVMPDLNQENPLTARYLIQNAIWWVETANLDGIRLDTFPFVGRDYWRKFHETLHRVYPHLTTVGEIFHRDPEVTSFFAGGVAHRGIDTGLDTPFDFPVYFTLRDVLAHDKPMTDLAAVLRQDALYPHPERLVSFIGNHDTTRFLTESGGAVPRLKLALGLEATLRGMPLIYSGDEIGMSGKEDPDNRHDFPGGFKGDRRSAFTREGRTAEEEDVFEWTSALLHLRAAHSVLQTGLEQNLFADQNRFAFVRMASESGCTGKPEQERVLVLVNKAKEEQRLKLPVKDTALSGCTHFASLNNGAKKAIDISAGILELNQPPESILLYSVQ